MYLQLSLLNMTTTNLHCTVRLAGMFSDKLFLGWPALGFLAVPKPRTEQQILAIWPPSLLELLRFVDLAEETLCSSGSPPILFQCHFEHQFFLTVLTVPSPSLPPPPHHSATPELVCSPPRWSVTSLGSTAL